MSGEGEVIDELMGMLARNGFVYDYERDVSVLDSRSMLVHRVATNRALFRSRAPCLADWVRWGGDTAELLRTATRVIQDPVGSCRAVPSPAGVNSPKPNRASDVFTAKVSEEAMFMLREQDRWMEQAISAAAMGVLGQQSSVVVYDPKSVRSPDANAKPPKLVPSTYGWKPESGNWVTRAEHDEVLKNFRAQNARLQEANARDYASTNRAQRLADECGALRAERDELLKENATLRRTVERLERKTGKTK